MQALKEVALRLLNVYVSPYVENLNAHDLSLSVFGGNMQFRGLHLKKTLLERFGLPVEVVAGDIGNLSVTIPWSQLKSQPVKIVIDDVYVLARVRPQGKVDLDEDERIEQATKQERLKSAEEVDNAASQVGRGAQTDEGKQTYIGAIVSKVVDNVQIHVKNIHLRYEDGSSTPEHPFAAGLTLSEFKAVSTDANWLETFIQDSLHGVHKLVKLEALSVYFDTDTGSLDKGPEDRAGTLEALKQMLAGSPTHQHILRPVTGEARVIVNKSMSSDTPKVDAQVIFDEIGVVFDRDQYRDALSVVDVFHFYRRTHQYHKYRPPEIEFEENPAKARLKFAMKAIASEVHERHRRWTWEYLAQRRDTRKRYVEVYVRKLALADGKPLPVEDGTALAEMETKLSYEDIRFFRSVARAQAKKDAATRRKLEAEKKAAQQPRQTWGQWLWGTGPTEDEQGGMTEDQKKEIDDIIDFDAAAAAQTIGTTPKDFMKARVAAKLNKGSFSLRVDPHGKATDIIALVFDSFSADAVQLTESVSGRLALGGFRVYDGTSPDSLYPQIVRVKELEKGRSDSAQMSLQDSGTEGALSALGNDMEGQTDAINDPFFVMEVEHNPLDGRADNALSVKMRHLEVLYHKGYVESIVQFFRPPESQLESITALIDAAGQTLDGIRQETRAGLEYALDNHSTVDLKVDMNAPIIVIPMDITVKDSQALVLDAGHISVESNLADKEQLKEVQSKRGRQYNDDDYKQLETLMYDRFSLQLQAAQLLMGPSVEACMDAIEEHHESTDSDLHILERINMSFSIHLAILNAPNLTRFKIAGDLPELQVNFSDRKYKTLMRFIDVAIPKFGDDTPAKDLPALPTVTAQALPSFRPRAIEEYNLDDTRSIRTADDDAKDDGSSVGDKGVDQFYEAQDDIADSQRAALQQVTFEFSFTVGKLQTSLFKSTSPTVEKPLADATLEGFGLTFALRKYDMSVDLFLRNVTLAMAGHGGAAKRPLLSSADEAASSPSSDLKLVRVKYMKVQKDSPEFMGVHEGVDQSVDTELSTFKITLAPEPILSLYDFIMTTFVPKDEGNEPVNEPKKPEEQAVQQTSSDKIRVRVKLTSAQVSLENNDHRFALLALPSADVAILLRSGTMRIGARLGALSLEDLSHGGVADPAFKKLLAIEGGDLADFSYETFDPSDSETFPGYNSSINLRAGSFKFTFMEQSIRDLYTWATKFAKMKAVYDAASQAAVQRASEVTRVHYDVVIKTPIIVLPRDGIVSADRLVLRLGEIVAKNEYLGDPNDTATIDAGLRGISVTSEITVDDKTSALQMVNDVAITAKIKQAGGKAHRSDPERADSEITTEMSDVKMSLTARQYVLLMDIVKALPRALSEVEADEDEDLPVATPATQPATPAANPENEDHHVNLEPELTVVSSREGQEPALWNAMDLVFDVGSIALEVYDADAIAKEDLKAHSIARFALVKSHLGFKRLSDGATEAEFTLSTLAFSNTRSGNSVFRDIIPHTTQNGNQIMVQYTMSGGEDTSSLAIVTIDSPKFILAIEPLAALLDFAVAPFKSSPEAESQSPEEQQVAQDPVETTSSGSMAFRVNIVQATVTVLANDSDPKSQAIELSIKEVLLSQQSILALKVDQLGMAFGRMDKSDARVRFLDDLNVALSLDTRRRGSQQMTSFEVEIPDAIIFRASYTDIMLITDIVNKALAVANKGLASGKAEGDSKRRQSTGDTVSTRAPATTTVTPAQRTVASNTTRRSSVSRKRVDQSKVLVSKEQLKATINGFQFVLIGDLQEMPMLHMSTNEFSVMINDWSGDMKMATSMTTSIRYFNLANSYFEPLMDPWTFDIRAQRTSISPDLNPLSVRFSAAERLEVNLTSAFVELAITSMTLWSKHGDKMKEGRGNDAPFRLRNYTGLTMLVWPESRDLTKKVSGVKSLDDGADVPWRFENPNRARENVSALRHNALGVQLKGSPWEAIRGISVDRAGEHVLALRPKLDKVSHQIACEIKLENNIKVITFRSTLNVENETNLPIEMIVVDSHGKAATGALRIDPGQSMPMPLNDAYDKRFRLRPLKGFNFDYSWSLPLHWRQLMSRPIRSISCKHQTPKEPAFYFQGQAIFDDNDPGTRNYPRMTLRLRSPLEVENLLPYDIRFRIHDKHSGLSSSNWLNKGLSSPIHTVEVSHLMLISISAEDTNLQQSDYAIIGSDDPELPQEDHFHMADQQGNKLMLKLHYYTYPDSGGAFKVQIYSPYIFLNKTGLPFDLAAKTWTGGQKPIAGNDLFGNDHLRDTPTPFMFGYPNEDRRNRLFLKVGDTKWSKPLSFEPVSADMQIVLGSASGKADTYVGLSYSEGLGKYKLTKVITIAPRFMVKNMFSYALKIRQHSTDKVKEVKPGETLPIHELQSGAPPQLSMAFDQPSLKWSAPFNLADIGRTNLALQRMTANHGERTYLMRVEAHIQGSSIFVYISRETEPWPLKIRNETSLKLGYQQVDDDTQKLPVREVRPKGEADYAWDNPTAGNKRLQISCDGVPLPKNIDMMAIGIQPPMKVSGGPQTYNKSVMVTTDIQADGSSQLLVISPYDVETSVYKPTRKQTGGIRRSDSTDSITTTSFETVAVPEKPHFSLTVELEGIGLSVVTKTPAELFYLSLRGLKLRYSDYPHYYEASVDCKWIQIDNQLFGGLFPIILYPSMIPKDGKELESHPTLQTTVAVLKDQSHGVIFIKYATILLQSMTVELDEDFLFALLEFVKFKDAAWREPPADVLIEHPKDILEPDITSGQADVFFETLHLQPVALELSFMRTERVNVDETLNSGGVFYYILNALTMTLGNVNAAPVNFRSLLLENVRLNIPSLQERVILHYQEQFVAQIYRVLGSADFLGNPVGLFTNISSGFSDIFYEPYQGMVMHGDMNIGFGLARGWTSFAKKTVFGISDSVTKVTSSIGKGLSAATLDSEYQARRRMTQRRNKPKHALYGVAAGASAFANSMTSAIEGVASKPFDGADRGGPSGFVKGVGQGVVGLFTKPAVGIFDFVSASTEGIRNTTTVFDQNGIDRARLPRFINSDGVLRPFSAREALGQSWLKELDTGAFNSESYVAHLDIPGDDSVAILSNNRILSVALRKLKVIWTVPFEELHSLSLESNGIHLIWRGNKPGPFLAITDPSSRDWFFKAIGKVVMDYNQKHRNG